MNLLDMIMNLSANVDVSWEKLINAINDSPILQALATILGIFGIGLITILTPVGRYIRTNIPYWFCKHISVYRGKGYYSEEFVVNHIKKSKKVIRIICVRNTRISSPDVLRAFRSFVTNRNGKVELFYLDPSSNISDDIIDKIRVTLPTPPIDAQTCRNEIKTNEIRTKAEIKTWDSTKQNNISLYRFRSLPSIHLCQFDNKIFLGFQFFDPSESATLSAKSLNDFCTIVNTKSALGKLIIEQIDYLRDNQSDKQVIN